MAHYPHNPPRPNGWGEPYFNKWNGRYSQYWVSRFQLIPEIPTSFDNANSIYELIAWLQGANKQLMNDFVNLELEWEQYKSLLIELLQSLIPALIYDFVHSEEFYKWIEEIIHSIIDEIIKEIYKKIEELENQLKELIKRVENLEKVVDELTIRLAELETRVTKLEERMKTLETTVEQQGIKLDKTYNMLRKIIMDIDNSGNWIGDSENLSGDLMNHLAYGTINVYGGEPEGSHFIKTKKSSDDYDFAVGV